MSRESFVKSLREVADFYEQNPQLSCPLGATFDVFSYSTREEASMVAAALGSAEKEQLPEYNLFRLTRHFGDVSLRFVFAQSNICKRRVVGTRTVPEQVVPATVIPAHEVEVVEWDCGEPLLAESVEEARG